MFARRSERSSRGVHAGSLRLWPVIASKEGLRHLTAADTFYMGVNFSVAPESLQNNCT